MRSGHQDKEMTDPEQERDERAVESRDRGERDPQRFDEQIEEVRVRTGEAEPVARELGDLDEALETHAFPTTADELIAEFGEWEVQSRRGWTSIEDVFASPEEETYASPDEVRSRIQHLVHRE